MCVECLRFGELLAKLKPVICRALQFQKTVKWSEQSLQRFAQRLSFEKNLFSHFKVDQLWPALVSGWAESWRESHAAYA